MKHLKMLGLAAVAAAALMAIVGATSASATVLCKTTPVANAAGTPKATCPSNWAYSSGTHIHAVNVGTVKLDTSFKTVECTGSTITGVTTNEGGPSETVDGPEGTLTFTGCNCEVVVIHPGTIEVHWIPHTENGTLTSDGGTVTVNCSTIFGNVHCNYVTNKISLGDITGGNPAIFHSIAVIERESTNALCSEESTWTATYEITEPKPLYVANET
jgi:hypothetical protein